MEWVDLIDRALWVAVTVGAAVLGFLGAGWQERRTRKAAEHAARQRQVDEALANVTVLLDRAIPDRFAMSYNEDESPQLLRDWEDEWRSVQRELAHAMIAGAETPAERQQLRHLSRLIGDLLNRLRWVASLMPAGEYHETLTQARDAHTDARAIVGELAAIAPSP